MDQYYIYLRKSRADRDAELHGAGETLLRHEKALMELARRQNLNVTKIFREIVSGETIAARPEVQKLLDEVASGIPKGVLVMEIERLARGDTRDQGAVADAFKSGNVKIITPSKTYDPRNEFDEEYFEFGLFMSRREYKAINRRIQRGRLASVREGKYIASTAPYGYERIRIPNDKGYTLRIIPEQAEVVRTIYSWYVKGWQLPAEGYDHPGMIRIAKKLDALHIRPPRSPVWSRATIRDILSNPTYIGKIRWQHRAIDGIHEAIIDEDMFQRAQMIMSERARPPLTQKSELKNPLSGIVVCGKCGRAMTRVFSNTKKGYYSLMCPNRGCSNVSAPLCLIEEKLLDGLKDWLSGYTLNWEEAAASPSDEALRLQERAILQNRKNLELLQSQLGRTFEFFERGIYTTDMFLERSQLLKEQISTLSADITRIETDLELLQRQSCKSKEKILNVENILELYRTLDSIPLKNELLKNILEKAEYTKDTRNKKGQSGNANFSLTLYPRLPQSQTVTGLPDDEKGNEKSNKKGDEKSDENDLHHAYADVYPHS